jgi:hypothetical protein
MTQDIPALVAKIAAWRDDDRQGYDTAIELLCDAESALRRLQKELDTCKRKLSNAEADIRALSM